MFKKLFILFIIFMLVVVYHKKIIDRIEIYAYDHQEADWAPKWEYHIGNFYYYTHKYDKAIEIYEWLLVFYKDKELELKSDIQYMLGRCYENKEDLHKAEAIYLKIIEKYPESDAADKTRRRFVKNMELKLY